MNAHPNTNMAEEFPDTGAVFTFGKSGFADNEPSHFFIKSDPVVAISCGDEHSAVICQNGRVFVFGGNSWGQLGLGHKDPVTRPSCVKWLKPHKALFVACGRAHTVFVTDTHAIYTVGCNEEGQLATGDTESHSVPQYVEPDSEVTRVRQVAAGCNHTALLTEEGKVFVSGSNTEGQLGLGEDTKTCLKFTELKFMEKIAFIECGYYHTVFITTKGVVFVTGDNEGNKLGIPGEAPTIYVPVELPMDTAIKSACCGANHTFLLSMDETKVLALGSNERGQLGLPKQVETVTEPTEIDMEKMFEGFQLKLVACGAFHTSFVTDNGLLYTCGEGRHNKLCLDEIVDDGGGDPDDGPPNQYSPKRVSAMNGYVVDNVACGGCHTLLTATKGSNADFTNNDFSVVDEQSRHVPLAELPPLQKLPPAMKGDSPAQDDAHQPNITDPTAEPNNTSTAAHDDQESINSLEANVSGSHLVHIDELENDSTHDIEELTKDAVDLAAPIEKTELRDIIDNMQNLADNVGQKIEDGVNTVKENIQEKVEAVEDVIKKTAANLDPCKLCEDRKILDVPDPTDEIKNSPPPKTPILPELLHVPDLSHLSPEKSKVSDDGQKSDCGSRSENETIPCASDKSSPLVKSAKTQAVMPIVRSEDAIDTEQREESDVVVNKMAERGRFSKIFQSIRDKESSCIGKGKVIEENVQETIHKGIDDAEQTVHRVEETVVTEIRDQTSSRTCTLL